MRRSAFERVRLRIGRVRQGCPSAGDDELARLLQLSADGNHDAFAELYERTHPQVRGAVIGVIRSVDHAADVTQDVFVQVWHQAGSYDPARGSVLAWLTTIARRRAVDRVRNLTRADARDLLYSSTQHNPPTDVVWDQVELHLDLASMRAAMQGLSPIQQQALQLAYGDPAGPTHVQLAELLGLPLGTVKSRIRDAIHHLRSTLTAAT